MSIRFLQTTYFPFCFMFVKYFYEVRSQYMLFWLRKDG